MRNLLRQGNRVTKDMVYRLIHAEKVNYCVEMMCRLAGLSRSGYYQWRERGVSRTAARRAMLVEAIEIVFDCSEGTYGYRRVHAELARRGIAVDDDTVRQIMRDHGWMPVQVKRRRSLTVADKQAKPLPDLVRRDFTARAPGAKMVGDITQIGTGEGPLFLATVIDCYSKAIIGWAVDVRYPAALPIAALEMAAKRIPIRPGAIFHSDRGSQYTSVDFGEALAMLGMRQSVGRTGICFDNSMAESFFGKLKTERPGIERFATRADARREIIRYIEGFYNRRRLHSAIDYRPPFEVLEEWFDNRRVA
jgi:putative transposase